TFRTKRRQKCKPLYIDTSFNQN
ncbi:sid-1-related precursor 3, partial [Danaus plexippus plexippus]